MILVSLPLCCFHYLPIMPLGHKSISGLFHRTNGSSLFLKFPPLSITTRIETSTCKFLEKVSDQNCSTQRYMIVVTKKLFASLDILLAMPFACTFLKRWNCWGTPWPRSWVWLHHSFPGWWWLSELFCTRYLTKWHPVTTCASTEMLRFDHL